MATEGGKSGIINIDIRKAEKTIGKEVDFYEKELSKISRNLAEPYAVFRGDANR